MAALFRRKRDDAAPAAYRIRGLAPGDFDALLRYDWSPLVAERDTIYLWLARDHARYCFVAEEDHAGEDGTPADPTPRRALGYLVSARSADGKAVFIFHVHVAPRARRRGMGRDLVLELERAAREDGVEVVWFLARPRVRGFYEALGYGRADDLLPDEAARYVRNEKGTGVMAKRLL